MSQDFSLRCDALPGDVSVSAFQGAEAISDLYELSLYLLGPEGTAAADLDAAVGASASLQIGDDDTYAIHGVFADVELIGSAGARPLICATLVPRLWLLTQSLHSRIFTDKALPDIVELLLKQGGLGEGDYVFELQDSYDPHEHVCQYRESDYDFIARWLEREGLYYFFEQGKSGEKLVITDSRMCQKPLRDAPVRYFAGGGGAGAGEHVRSFRRKRRVLPRKVGLSDYDYLHPETTVRGAADIADGTAGEIHDHRGRFADGDRGGRLAKRRAEGLLCHKTVCRAEATSRAHRSGYFFTLDDHPDSSLNEEYLVTRLEHLGLSSAATPEVRRLTGIDIAGTYRAEVVAIPSSVQYRSPAKTRWPRVTGYESAVIDGPAEGDAAQIDEHGRYKVKLRLDESDLDGGKASTWVRRMQPYAGVPEGFHFPLRKGTEVMVTFLGGDPDQPVIAGAIPNATTPSPVTSAHPMSNVIHTAGDNHIELGDTPGAQFITLSTPNKKTVFRMGAGKGLGDRVDALEGEVGELKEGIALCTEGDREDETEGDEDKKVKGNLKELIMGSKVDTVMGFETGTILGLKTEQVGGGEVKTVIAGVAETVIGAEDKNVIGGEVKNVIGLFPIASQINVLGVENKNVLGAGVTNVFGGEVKLVVGGVQETILGGEVGVIVGAKSETITGIENKNVLGGVIDLIGGVESKTVLGGVVDVVCPIEFKTVIGAVIDIVIGAKVDLVVGAKVEAAAATFSETEAKLESMEASLEEHAELLLACGSYLISSGAITFN